MSKLNIHLFAGISTSKTILFLWMSLEWRRIPTAKAISYFDVLWVAGHQKQALSPQRDGLEVPKVETRSSLSQRKNVEASSVNVYTSSRHTCEASLKVHLPFATEVCLLLLIMGILGVLGVEKAHFEKREAIAGFSSRDGAVLGEEDEEGR